MAAHNPSERTRISKPAHGQPLSQVTCVPKIAIARGVRFSGVDIQRSPLSGRYLIGSLKTHSKGRVFISHSVTLSSCVVTGLKRKLTIYTELESHPLWLSETAVPWPTDYPEKIQQQTIFKHKIPRVNTYAHVCVSFNVSVAFDSFVIRQQY